MHHKIVVFHTEQCSPKKCTTRRLAKQKEIKMVTHLNQIPRGALVLDPFSPKAVSPEDHELVVEKAL